MFQFKKTIKSEYGKEAIKMLPVVEEIIDIYCNHYDSVLMSKELILTYTDAKKIIEKFKKGEIFRVIQAENGINVEFEEIPEKSLFDAINMLAS